MAADYALLKNILPMFTEFEPDDWCARMVAGTKAAKLADDVGTVMWLRSMKMTEAQQARCDFSKADTIAAFEAVVKRAYPQALIKERFMKERMDVLRAGPGSGVVSNWIQQLVLLYRRSGSTMSVADQVKEVVAASPGELHSHVYGLVVDSWASLLDHAAAYERQHHKATPSVLTNAALVTDATFFARTRGRGRGYGRGRGRGSGGLPKCYRCGKPGHFARDCVVKEAYYAVAVGRQVGVFTDWTEASASVNGYSNAVHKKFDTKEDAAAFVAARMPKSQQPSSSSAIKSGFVKEDFDC